MSKFVNLHLIPFKKKRKNFLQSSHQSQVSIILSHKFTLTYKIQTLSLSLHFSLKSLHIHFLIQTQSYSSLLVKRI